MVFSFIRSLLTFKTLYSMFAFFGVERSSLAKRGNIS